MSLLLINNRIHFFIPSQISSIAGSSDFHSQSGHDSKNSPLLFAIFAIEEHERLLCAPVFTFSIFTKLPVNPNNPFETTIVNKVLIRGDSYGRISTWNMIDHTPEQITQAITTSKPLILPPNNIYSLKKSWESMVPSPGGMLDCYCSARKGDPHHPSGKIKITASVYLPLQGRLICGREDGTIIILSAAQTIINYLLEEKKRKIRDDWPQCTVLHGHSGRINCLLYPRHCHERYDICHLVSGGVDFSVCLWDIYTGELLHRFSVHAGEITQLCVPPKDCNPRALSCITSIASDHSVALLSLKAKKCLLIASRHMFPISVIKWRPLDDFMVVGCTDGSVYVWQMETGHLDRVVTGITADEILAACDDHTISTSGGKLSNPAVHLIRGMRARNLAAIRHAAARGLTQLVGPSNREAKEVVDLSIQSQSHPLMIHGLKANPKDQDCHVLFFDLESAIVNLLSEEYALLSPNSLEAKGLTANTEYQKFYQMANSQDHGKLSTLFAKVKENAGSAAQKIQAKAERVGFKPGTGEGSILVTPGSRKDSSSSIDDHNTNGVQQVNSGKDLKNFSESKLTMEIAQILLSLLHAWGLDPDLDKVCESKLGLLRPLRPVCFGLLAKNGHMAILFPMTIARMDKTLENATNNLANTSTSTTILSPETLKAIEEGRASRFAAKIHWELSTSITTSHILAILSVANTLMSMSSATFVADQEKKRMLVRKLTRTDSKSTDDGTNDRSKHLDTEALLQEAHQIKQGWSLLAALHCVLLPDLVKTGDFKRPLFDALAWRWQDRCLEIRQAAQALLLAELRRIGMKGRKQLVAEWASFLPAVQDAATLALNLTTRHVNDTSSIAGSSAPGSEGNSLREARPVVNTVDGQNTPSMVGNDSDDDVEDIEVDHVSDYGSSHGASGPDASTSRRTSTVSYGDKRRQMTAIILLGVIGSEYGVEVDTSKQRAQAPPPPPRPPLPTAIPEIIDISSTTSTNDSDRQKCAIEGFGGNGNNSLARHTAHALTSILLIKQSSKVIHPALKRAAIDLIGRGYTIWEPFVDASKILLTMLEFTTENEKIVPSMTFGLPLTPSADAARSARHSISLIATARPAAFITTLAREVARYNSIQQNPQSMNVNLFNTVLVRAKPEMLRNMELLIEKMPTDVTDLIIESVDIILHCLDLNNLKNKGLVELFPAIGKFPNVTYCNASKRIAVGAKNGSLAIFELRTPQKSQLLTAHSRRVTCVSFAPDGKHLATYSIEENKICFWSTGSSLFGLGQSQIRCIKYYNTKPVGGSGGVVSLQDPIGSKSPPRLIWTQNKALILMFADGSECRFSV